MHGALKMLIEGGNMFGGKEANATLSTSELLKWKATNLPMDSNYHGSQYQTRCSGKIGSLNELSQNP